MTLTIDDIRLMAGIIDTASTRGAFKGNELANVGTVFNKLSSIIIEYEKANQPAEQPAEVTEQATVQE